jgi:hypothetical protein
VDSRWPLRALGAVVIGLTIVSGVHGCQQDKTNTRLLEQTQRSADQTERTAQCLKNYANGTADAIDARTAAANTAAEALDELFEEFLKATPDQAGRDRARALFEDYVAKRKAARQAQVDHPYPPAPRNLC